MKWVLLWCPIHRKLCFLFSGQAGSIYMCVWFSYFLSHVACPHLEILLPPQLGKSHCTPVSYQVRQLAVGLYSLTKQLCQFGESPEQAGEWNCEPFCVDCAFASVRNLKTKCSKDSNLIWERTGYWHFFFFFNAPRLIWMIRITAFEQISWPQQCLHFGLTILWYRGCFCVL